jgi:hypothetical protein
MGSSESDGDRPTDGEKLIVSPDLQPLVDELLRRGWDRQAILSALADKPQYLAKPSTTLTH